MLKEYTTKKIIEISEECGYDKKWMKRLWIPKINKKKRSSSRIIRTKYGARISRRSGRKKNN